MIDVTTLCSLYIWLLSITQARHCLASVNRVWMQRKLGGGRMLGGAYLGYILVLYCEYLWYILVLYWGYLRDILAIAGGFGGHLGHIVDSVWQESS